MQSDSTRSERFAERSLTLADRDAILELWRRSGLTSIRPDGRDSQDAFARQFASGMQQILGLEDEDRLIGVIVATHDGRKGWLNRLAIDPAYRGLGLARRLICSAEEWLASQSILVWAVLIEDPNEASLRLFQSEGYVLDPHIHYLSKRPSDRA